MFFAWTVPGLAPIQLGFCDVGNSSDVEPSASGSSRSLLGVGQ